MKFVFVAVLGLAAVQPSSAFSFAHVSQLGGGVCKPCGVCSGTAAALSLTKPPSTGRRSLLGRLHASGQAGKGGDLVETVSKRADAAAMRYWDGMNRRDVEYALDQFADDILFQDMMFSQPFTNKEQLKKHFETCLAGFPEGLKFVIDEISVDSGDGKCGAYWHCETATGRAFPFSRGLSFYKVNALGKIIFAREIPEPPTKSGRAGTALAKFGAFMLNFVPDSIQWPKV